MEKQMVISKYIYDNLNFLEMNEDFYTDNQDILKFFIRENVIEIFHDDNINLDNVYNFSITKEKNSNNEMVLHFMKNGVELIVKKLKDDTLSFYKKGYELLAYIKKEDISSYTNLVFKDKEQIGYNLKMTDNLIFAYSKRPVSGGMLPTVVFSKVGKIMPEDFNGVNKFKIVNDQEDIDISINVGLDCEEPMYNYLKNVFDVMSIYKYAEQIGDNITPVSRKRAK